MQENSKARTSKRPRFEIFTLQFVLPFQQFGNLHYFAKWKILSFWIKKAMKTLKLILFLLVISSTGISAQNRIEVEINEIKDDVGTIIVGLFSDEATFLKKPFIGKTVKATQGKLVVIFDQVPSGTYAISIIHDSNANGELDSNLFGIPKEGFGFSNDAMGMFGPPSFEKAKLVVSSSTTTIVKMRYM